MALAISLGLEDPTPGCDDPFECDLGDENHDGPCAYLHSGCGGRGCGGCAEGLVWSVA